MVKAIWASYFQFGSNADADAAAKEAEATGEAAPAAQAVEEVHPINLGGCQHQVTQLKQQRVQYERIHGQAQSCKTLMLNAVLCLHQDENDEEEEEGAAAEVEDALAEPSPTKKKPTKKQQAAAKAAAAAAVAWVGAVTSTVSGAKFYG